ncbi:MAG TPA: serine/threonine-protein kinase [Polyangiaceae bacterium]|nr:serine/threonine-protein kinase [Polyangiaceae bacterium]
MDLEPGLFISEHIQLRKLIGEGGMGEIWEAHHVPLRRRVAVKCLASALAENYDILQRFATEGQTAARLPNEHVPQVFDSGMLQGGRPYIVMELLAGVELQQRLREKPPLTLSETARLVEHVCSALSAAHALGIVHRDIKPENIFLVGPPGGPFVAKLLDFGIAKTPGASDAKSVTCVGAVLGTPSYMSPEQLVDPSSVDSRADLWSLAVVAYGCLTAELPFPGDTLGALCLSIQRGVFRDASALRPDLPRSLDAWFKTALAAKPEDRFASAAEFARTFAEAARAEVVVARPDADAVRARMPRAKGRLELPWPNTLPSSRRPRRRPGRAWTFVTAAACVAATALACSGYAPALRASAESKAAVWTANVTRWLAAGAATETDPPAAGEDRVPEVAPALTDADGGVSLSVGRPDSRVSKSMFERGGAFARDSTR